MKKKLSRSALKARARKLMVGKYGSLALITVLVSAANLISSSLLGNLFYSGSGIFNSILQLATTAVVNVFYTLLLAGQTGIYLKVCSDEFYSLRDLLRAFRDRPDQVAIYSVIAFALQTVMLNVPLWLLEYAIFTGSTVMVLLMTVIGLVLIVVIGILMLSLSLVLYLYIDHPYMSAMELIRESRRLMKGNRLRLFLLELSFLGLDLLGLLSFGVGILFIEPYRQITKALFYRRLSDVSRYSHMESA